MNARQPSIRAFATGPHRRVREAATFLLETIRRGRDIHTDDRCRRLCIVAHSPLSDREKIGLWNYQAEIRDHLAPPVRENTHMRNGILALALAFPVDGVALAQEAQSGDPAAVGRSHANDYLRRLHETSGGIEPDLSEAQEPPYNGQDSEALFAWARGELKRDYLALREAAAIHPTPEGERAVLEAREYARLAGWCVSVARGNTRPEDVPWRDPPIVTPDELRWKIAAKLAQAGPRTLIGYREGIPAIPEDAIEELREAARRNPAEPGECPTREELAAYGAALVTGGGAQLDAEGVRAVYLVRKLAKTDPRFQQAVSVLQVRHVPAPEIPEEAR